MIDFIEYIYNLIYIIISYFPFEMNILNDNKLKRYQAVLST